MRSVPNNRLVASQVFETLLEALLTGRYAPGEKLPPQRVLAADLGVTLTALRESLKRLEQMGLIVVRHGDAMRVRDWRAHGGLDVIAHLLFRAGRVDAHVLFDVLEARSLMLREIGGLAAARREDAQAARLVELAARMRSTTAETAPEVDFAFFTELAQAAGNLVFVLILNAIRGLYLEHAARIPVTAGHRELALLYEALAAAVASGDAERAQSRAWELAERQRRGAQAALSASAAGPGSSG